MADPPSATAAAGARMLATPPASPARARAPRLEDYVKMDDSPRHSRESTRSLLHGQHSRSNSAQSFDSFQEGASGQERSSVTRAPGLASLQEEEGLANGRAHDDEFPQHERRSSIRTKIERNGGAGPGESSLRHTRRPSFVPPIVQDGALHAASFVKDNRGILMIASSQACFAAMNAMVKIMTSSDVAVPIWELIFSRMSLTWICCYIYMRVNGVEDPLLGPKGVRLLLALRGFVGFFGLFGSYYSLQYLSLSDATVINFLAPTVTAIFGSLMLGEPYTLREAISGLISLGGAILVAQPSFLFGSLADEEGDPKQRLVAVAVAFSGVFGAALAYICIRQIGKRAHALHSVTYFCIGCVFTSVLMPFFMEGQKLILPSRPVFWLYLTGIGIAGFAAQFLMSRALQIERVGRALLGQYTQLPWALTLQYILFGEVMDLLSTLGATVIMSSTCWVVLTKDKEKAGNKVEGGHARTHSISSAAHGGAFATDTFETNGDSSPVETRTKGNARYTALSSEVDDLEAGLQAPVAGSSGVEEGRHPSQVRN